MDLSKRRECRGAVPDAYFVETFPGMRTTLLQAQSEGNRHVVWEENSELYYLLVLTGAASAAKYLRKYAVSRRDRTAPIGNSRKHSTPIDNSNTVH